MKLLYCDKCKDVIRLIIKKWRVCSCKQTGGQYNSDGLTATIGGTGRVIGISNPFFSREFDKIHKSRNKSQKEYEKLLRSFRKKYEYLHNQSEAWWGEHKGDWQLHRIKTPKGPILCERSIRRRMNIIFRKYRFKKTEINQCLKEFNHYKKLIKNYKGI